MRLEIDPRDPLAYFIVVRLSWHDDENPCNILNRSGAFSRMHAAWDYRHEGSKMICTVKVEGNVVAKATNDSKLEARSVSCF